ncbi:MAG: hypothetical protein QXK89_08765 [Candidatus Bathyarchaeia archaeon]|nr:hypothetical protein [Candidatus Bathyarchaeota archaeon]
MRLMNYTDISISLEDLLDKETWEVERRSTTVHVRVDHDILKGWVIKVYWLNKNARKPYRGQFDSSKKLITVGISRKITYPFSAEIPVKTNKTRFGYKYVTEKVVFYSPKELIRFIFLHEFSHLIDYLRGLNLNFKQTKANRFALRYLR